MRYGMGCARVDSDVYLHGGFVHGENRKLFGDLWKFSFGSCSSGSVQWNCAVEFASITQLMNSPCISLTQRLDPPSSLRFSGAQVDVLERKLRR